MSLLASPLLFADFFDRFRIQLADPIVNWLIPVWILCIGAAAGLALTAAIWGVLKLLSLLPGIGTLADAPGPRRLATAVLTILLLGLAVGLYLTNVPNAQAAPILDRIWALAGAALACWVLATALVTLVSRRALAETRIAIREGVLWPLFIAALVMTGFAVFGLFIVRKPTELLESLVRGPQLALEGDATMTRDLAAPANPVEDPVEQEVPVNFRRDEIRGLVFKSDQRVKLRSEPTGSTTDPSLVLTLDIPAGESKTWRREQTGTTPFREPVITKLYAKNQGLAKATLQITPIREVATPEMVLVPIMAVGMAAIFFLYLLQRAALPKLAAVALSTAKSDIAQPLYAILMAIGVFLLLLFVFIPYNTFGDDIKQLKDSGLSLILVLCVFQSVWAASSSVADEVEGKTALTVLSKPVSRRDFILGKFTGIAWSVGLMCAIFGLLLLVTVAYKPIYDFREGGYEINHQQQNQDPTWHDCHREMVQIVPGIVLVFLETLVIAALSVAISTRLPALANFIISFSIYVLGHLTPLLVQSQVVANQLPPVIFFGNLIATVLPVLDHFNIQASVAAGVPVPIVYLMWSLVYCILYSSVAMLLALTLFEDRDLA